MTNDDNRLMSELKSGQVTALSGLVEKYKKQAYFVALGMVGNSEDAYDISQEAFLRVYRSAKTYNEERSFFPWFYSIILNLCRNLLKKRSINNSRSVNIDDVSYMLADRETPEKIYLESEEKQRLLSSLSKLNFSDREIINLNHFRMMNYEEISGLLDIPKGTVMSRLYYARKRLAQLMEEEV